MNISEPFVRRPVATVLLTVAIGFLGVIAYSLLPIASLPLLERPSITVLTNLPGANAETVASTVTSPLERQLGLIAGIKEIASASFAGQSRIVMEFALEKNIDEAAGAVQAAINAAGPSLPSFLPRPPQYLKANANGFPIVGLALTSDVYDVPDLYDFADSVIAQKLSQIKGIAHIFISGAGKPAVRIQVNPRMLADMNLSIETVRNAITRTTVDLPKGEISDKLRSLPIAANGQLFKAADFLDVSVQRTGDAPIKLRDIAKITDSTVNDKRAGWFDEKPAVVIYVLKEPDANVVETVDEILTTIPQLKNWMPPSVKINLIYDRTLLIRAAIADVQMTIGIAIGLVVLVIALFLRRFWATVIPSVTIPVSMAVTLVAIYFLGFSLNNISLLALTIAIGFVIDDAIIIIENITRLIQEGESPLEASLKGTRQMGFTVISITAALIAALIPILFMPDIVGRLFREFGLTLVAAIVASAVISLTLTPMMCGQLLRRSKPQSEGRISQACERFVDRCVALYASSLDVTLRLRWVTLTAAAVLVAATVGLYVKIPKGFLPTQDTGILRVTTVAIPNISFAAMEERQRMVAARIQADPAVGNVASYIGNSVLSIGTMLVNLKPPEVRKESVDQVIARMRRSLADIKGMRTFLTPVQDISVGAGGGVARYQYVLSSLNEDELVQAARLMRQRITALPQATDVVWNYETFGLEASLNINRARAALAGVTVSDIDNVLYDWFGQRQITAIRRQINYSLVVLEVEPEYRQDTAALTSVFLSQGVPVEAMSEPRRQHSPVWIRHTNQLSSITISFNTPLGVSIGQAQAAIRSAEATAKIPPEVKTDFRGEARDAEQNSRTQPLLFLAALIAVYIILGMLYESYAHPFTILSTLPSAAFGALLILYASSTQFTVITAIACILVVGIVMKNAIMMVDFALDAERRLGLSAELAIRQAARSRFRPIVMTTLAALLGALPLALGTGAGHELRQPLGIAIVGGLLLSQFVTLYTTPAVYLAVDMLRSRRRKAAPAAPASPVAS